MNKFKRSLFGYNTKEVNAFIDDIIKNVERIIESNKSKSEKILKLENEIEYVEGGCLYDFGCDNRKEETKVWAAPTLWVAMKWLMEVHNIGIFPSLFAFCVGEGGAAKPTYGTKIISLKSCELLTDDTNPMPTYEEACEAGIKYCLQNLI